MVNSSLKKLKFHLASFDLVVKERTTATAITEGTWGFEHTKACFRDEIIPFVKALKELFNSFDQFLIDELTEVQNVFNQIEQAVEQHCVKKIKFQDKMKNVLKDNERLLKQAISVDIVNIVVHDHVNSADKTVNEKVLVIATLKETLRRLKGKVIVNEVVSLHSIDPELLKIDVAPLAPKLRNNRTTHTDYLRHTQEETGDRSQLINFVHKFLGTVKFGNDHVAKIIGYGDYKIGNVTISSVYFVEGLEHNLFSVGQFYDSDLEVAFRQHTCFIRNLDGIDLLTGSRENNLYTLSLQDMMASSPICLLSKGTKTKSWLWHHRLSHLNCGAINHLARQGLVRGLPKLKFEKDHLCSACAMGKRESSHWQYKFPLLAEGVPTARRIEIPLPGVCTVMMKKLPVKENWQSSSHRPHGGSMRPSHRSTGHRPHGPSMNPRRPTMNGERPYKSFFTQSPSYETRPFLKSSVVKTPYRAPWENLWDELYRLETNMEDVEGCLWCRDLYGEEEERDVASLKTKKWIMVLVSSL
nr:integrase, catalytic region, zinc finger, CCHC-type, peptidase aspartic, catalytic [Tanacetum cinerariifolium]